MDFGLYEKLLDSEVKNQISELYNETRKVDKSESAKVLATAYYKILRKILSEKKEEEKIDFVRKLNKEIGNEILFEDDKDFLELLALHEDKDILKKLIDNRPKTSISSSTLFTGYTGPTLESELRREIRTADRIDFIVSFIKYSGLVLILEDLKEFTKTKKLRIITTSYMGASDYKAILKLSQLPNTEVKISYDTNRTRLHAKAYYFERNTGFSTAYIGSSNISNPALSKGLEWNLKVSEYTSKDVVDSIIKTFETYWNDEEFRTFMPGEEEDKKELKIALSRKEKDDDKKYVFFDLKPYSHQKEILEDLRVEREEYESYKNLVVAATGSGKTTTVLRTIEALKDEMSIGVLEADIDSDVDANTVSKTGAKVIQLHTGGMCHLDADMTKQGLNGLGTEDIDFVILENVGNLVCPAEFDTGASKNAMILSIPEGDDKPLKYPLMFSIVDVLLINKIDAIDYFDFHLEAVKERVKKLNPNIKVIPISARTGEGIDDWVNWIRNEVKDWNKK